MLFYGINQEIINKVINTQQIALEIYPDSRRWKTAS